MNITTRALKNPAGVAIFVTLCLVLGIVSFTKLPIQLFPDIERPQITIFTSWRQASPAEMESEILEPQEDVLQGLPGLTSLRTFANSGSSFVNLTFTLDTDMDKTLIEVISRMNRVPPLPRDVNPPVISLGGFNGGAPALTYFFLQALPGNDKPIGEYATFFDDTIRPRLESIPGVARVQLQTGNSREQLQIEFDAYRAAELGINLTRVSNLIGSANDASGGYADIGRRRYTLRFAGRFDPTQLGNLVLEWRDGKPIKLSDIAEIKVTRDQDNGSAVQNGNPAMSVRIDRESGANVLATLERVKEEVDKIRSQVLEPQQLTMHQSFDASVFIYRAINLVSSNLVLGILLAVGVLWWFLRQRRATLIVAMAIPISIMTTFIVLNITGRSLNVISLAGLAFATGMVLDAAIVVLENIVRLKTQGLRADKAAAKGTQLVSGALMASTATTIAIFIPVIFLRDVAGQFFADLALTIAIAVFISLLVALTILPVAAKMWLTQAVEEDRLDGLWQNITSKIMQLTNSSKKRVAVIVTLMAAPVALTVLLLPPLDYLPPVKRDAVDAFVRLPTGSNQEFVEREYIKPLVERLQPYMDGTKQPALKNYYILSFPGNANLGVRAKDQSQVKELERVMREEILVDLPDTRVFSQQGNLFGGLGSGRSIQIHLQSRDTRAMADVADKARDILQARFEGSNININPGTQDAEPELRLLPNDRRMMEVGFNRRDLAQITRAMGTGLYVGEYFDGNKRLDMIFKAEGWQNPEELSAMPITTPSGTVVQLGELVDVTRTVGPSRIQRIDRRRTITVNVNPPEGMSLQQAMSIIETEIEPQLKALMPADGSINYGGSADSLKQSIQTMGQNFILALGLLFILMAGLFKSLKDSLMVTLSIPLATVGGVLALQMMNLIQFQPLDLLTMIGFIILLGLVVNNAILLVDQTRQGEREGLSREMAVEQALKLRLRPIFMSTLTSIFGMLPLLIMPGEGSVIYRGLAAVIVGGMLFSTLFTLVLLPALLKQFSTRTSVQPTPVTSTQTQLEGN
ncbi:efflux RND transporter permease subunit [Pseudoalteromonas sp. SSM20]|uniref:efflux RND transporter permease subunit n=2 Tax=unclassified Pseudoalteromonas TaxID=194690 RepID=UPI003BAAB56A